MSGKVPESFSMERKHMTEEMKMSENLPGGQRTAAQRTLTGTEYSEDFV